MSAFHVLRFLGWRTGGVSALSVEALLLSLLASLGTLCRCDSCCWCRVEITGSWPSWWRIDPRELGMPLSWERLNISAALRGRKDFLASVSEPGVTRRWDNTGAGAVESTKTDGVDSLMNVESSDEWPQWRQTWPEASSASCRLLMLLFRWFWRVARAAGDVGDCFGNVKHEGCFWGLASGASSSLGMWPIVIWPAEVTVGPILLGPCWKRGSVLKFSWQQQEHVPPPPVFPAWEFPKNAFCLRSSFSGVLTMRFFCLKESSLLVDVEPLFSFKYWLDILFGEVSLANKVKDLPEGISQTHSYSLLFFPVLALPDVVVAVEVLEEGLFEGWLFVMRLEVGE